LKALTGISLPWNLHLALTAGNQRQKVISDLRRRLLVCRSLCLRLRLHMYLSRRDCWHIYQLQHGYCYI